ncbi:hypothetical protein RJ45_08515 [Photobacterium gaetbulicola]|uniref:Beta-lactamase-related domain-containing protein n=1 Tax=Photobacterium gaetbulicola TaxID=1295392 RepID=A0A0B9GZH7_9GAMM|nr:serine hydrolase [Photobacterium gaetbulicola]KHT64121.1 hypothetical protein RJ45_08515 [Photobacterium gaetbulicola]
MFLRNKLRILITSVLFASATTGAFASEQKTWQELGIMQGVPAAADKQVTSRNWVWYPYNRWSFQNVNKILPTTEVPALLPAPLPEGNRADLLGLATKRSTGESSTIAELLDDHHTDAFMVLHQGKVVGEHYWNGMKPDSTHWIASMTKSFIGLSAEMLIEQGVIERSKRAEHYVEALKGTALGSATVQQLLDMTAGTAWDESMSALQNETSFARQYGNAAGTWPMGTPSNGVFGILPQIEKEREHGQQFMYNSPQTDTMGWVITAVTGQRIEKVISRLFFEKMGAQDRAFMMADTNTYGWATGGLNISARDAAKFGQMLADKGQFNQQSIFPTSVYDNIVTGDASKFAGSPYDSRIPGGAYSSFFWLLNDEDGAFMAKGMFSQYIYVNPTKNVVIVRFASPEISSMPEYDLDMISAFNTISQALTKS